MTYLLLSILSSTLILITFKYAGNHQIDLFKIVVINYFSASILGHLINDPSATLSVYNFTHTGWISPALIIGVLLIAMFYIMGLSSHKAGVSITGVASKMSVIVPITFSILFYDESLHFLKLTGIILAIIAVTFSSLKKSNGQINKYFLFLPILIFLGTGTIDALIKYTQQEFISNDTSAVFTSILFGIAFIIGIVISISRRIPFREFIEPKVFTMGTFVGICNFGSIFFLIMALNQDFQDSSIIFGINNLGVVALSVLLGLIIFREKLTRLNWSGIALSFVAIWLLNIS